MPSHFGPECIQIPVVIILEHSTTGNKPHLRLGRAGDHLVAPRHQPPAPNTPPRKRDRHYHGHFLWRPISWVSHVAGSCCPRVLGQSSPINCGHELRVGLGHTRGPPNFLSRPALTSDVDLMGARGRGGSVLALASHVHRHVIPQDLARHERSWYLSTWVASTSGASPQGSAPRLPFLPLALNCPDKRNETTSVTP
jgi:hypothetical protein